MTTTNTTTIKIDEAEYALEVIAIALRYSAHDAEGSWSTWLLVCAAVLEAAHAAAQNS